MDTAGVAFEVDTAGVAFEVDTAGVAFEVLLSVRRKTKDYDILVMTTVV